MAWPRGGFLAPTQRQGGQWEAGGQGLRLHIPCPAPSPLAHIPTAFLVLVRNPASPLCLLPADMCYPLGLNFRRFTTH